MSIQTTDKAAPQITSLDDFNYGTNDPAIEIYHPSKEEVISTTGRSKEVSCIINRPKDPSGFYQGEDYYLAIPKIAPDLKEHLRQVKFHGSHSKSSGNFIFPEKQSPRGRKNTWNTSLGNILKTQPGIYFSISSDRDNARYLQTEIERVEIPPTFDDFEEQLLANFQDRLITSLDHPVIQKILGK